MRIFAGFLKERAREILLYIITLALLKFVFFLYNLPSDALNYGFLLVLVLAGILFFIDFCEFYKRHKELVLVEKNMQDALLDLPEPDTLIENDYQDLLDKLEEIRRKLKSEELISRQEMQDYYGMWVHQIKTPIASMHLILQKEDSEDSRRLRAELFRVEQYVQMVLCFLRLDSDFTDYVIKEYRVDDIIRPAVRRLAPQFIMKKLALEYEHTDEVALTDEKWLGFVVEQVLSNAVKYTSEGSISIKCDGDRLVISDTGIGIAAEDLPRIFDKGYTGFNGRADRKASGIGLYLCRRICDNLGHSIKVESAAGQGTTITIGLRRNKLEVE